jgi:hypothetical protein
MMTWALVALGAAAVVAFLLWPPAPHPNPLADSRMLPRMLRLLLSRGVYAGEMRGSLAVCLREDPQRRFVFRKYIRDAGVTGFETEFPLEGWSEPFYARFRDELVRRGVPHRELTSERGPMLAFDFGRDFGLAHVVVHVLFEDVMGARVARDCVGYFHDCLLINSPRLTGVDAPDEGWG